MTTLSTSRSEQVRSRLDHPVIDADGHMVEFVAPVEDYVKAIGGADYEVRFFSPAKRFPPQSDDDRRSSGSARPPWWVVPTRNTLDRATAALPKLLSERMEELGLDYCVLFPTAIGFEVSRAGMSPEAALADPEVGRVRARALNAYRADLCRDHADRMTPVASVRMTTPKVAIEDLEHAVVDLGYKAIAIHWVLRPIREVRPDRQDAYTSLFSMIGSFLDTFGLDSAYDYDPCWARCAELKVPVMSHGHGMGFTGRNSPTNHTFNHIGNFADSGEAMCKSLFLGGVTRRFPTLKFAFLEGGVATGCRVFSDLVSHWHKRGGTAVQHYNPAYLDRDLFLELHRRYGGEWLKGRMDRVLEVGPGIEVEEIDDPAALDDFARCGIQRAEDIRDLFIPSFFFGCEADDPMNALAFQSRLLPFDSKVNALFSSDIGHWDVPDMREVVAEAHELVEKGLLTDDDFRDFTFVNPVKLLAGSNPDFFKGTAVEREVERELMAMESRS